MRGGTHALPEPVHRPTRAGRQRRSARQGRRPHRRRRRQPSTRHRAGRCDRPSAHLPALVAGRPLRRVRRTPVRRDHRHDPVRPATERDPAAGRPARQADRGHRRPPGRAGQRPAARRRAGATPPRGGRRRGGGIAAPARDRGCVPDPGPEPAAPDARALHRLGGRGPGRDQHRLDPPARAACRA